MSETLRIGISGAGWWAVENHLPILKARDDVSVVGVCRLGAEELASVQKRFDIPFGSESFDALLDVELDALVIASPHALHGPQAVAALEAGRHVMVEKPLAQDITEARRILELSRKEALHVLVPFGWNFGRLMRHAHEIMHSGRIGRLRHVAGIMASPIGDLLSGGGLEGTEAAMFQPDPATWSDPATGGYGWGQLVHVLGGLFYILDAAPAEVFAMTDRAKDNADMFNAIAMRFENGATMSLSGAATVPMGKPFQVDLRFFGTEGMLLLDVERERCELTRFDGTEEALDVTRGEGAYTCEAPVHHFVDLCLGKAQDNPADALVGLRAVQVVDAMHRSARNREIVAIKHGGIGS